MRPWETAGWRSLPFFYLLPAAALRLGAYIIDTGQPCHTDVSIVCAFYAELVGEAWGRMPLLDNRWRGFMGCPDGLPIECLVCRRIPETPGRGSSMPAGRLTYYQLCLLSRMAATLEFVDLRAVGALKGRVPV
jgi:hypothetical protein